ncbi:hypothetical protein LBMAG57_29960 [Verrucomicrobiota bacterium]|nr:hypothetical protein LBMAG57_29960 [Verrucomicrobiota bacterium]
MKTPSLPSPCPDRETPRIIVVHEPLPQIERRAFLKKTIGALAATAIAPLAHAAKGGKSETLVQQFAKTLTEAQRAKVWFPFDDRKRTLVDNNWHIVDEKVGAFFTKDQQAMIREIFLGLHSPEYAEKVMQQVVHDSGKAGFEDSSIALFGEPESGKFEFVLTGRHCTRRCDGDSVEGAAFGGPIFYGHAAGSFNETAEHPGNAYWYQAKRANAAFQMLDGKQREKALLDRGREETGNSTVKLQGKGANIEGLAVADMTKDQREGVRGVLSDLLAPFRKEDADEALKYVDAAGFDNVHMAFYKAGDIGKDGVWDVWQLEGPNMVWYFRGAPHVHVWVNIAAGA